jgi:hypothetical protein
MDFTDLRVMAARTAGGEFFPLFGPFAE